MKFLIMLATASLVDKIVDATEGEHGEGSKVFAFGEVGEGTEKAIADALDNIDADYDDHGAGDNFTDPDPENTGVESDLAEDEDSEDEDGENEDEDEDEDDGGEDEDEDGEDE